MAAAAATVMMNSPVSRGEVGRAAAAKLNLTSNRCSYFTIHTLPLVGPHLLPSKLLVELSDKFLRLQIHHLVRVFLLHQGKRRIRNPKRPN
ncbi:hypothetical protein M5K25_021081 [Dendrobium thyrsiflorum]|uniref:Uncharacterized protein n=1 Tax=Dendrobium thyrsiflorum TaxID=117978 RepID=A0ABD0UBG7_DENTH